MPLKLFPPREGRSPNWRIRGTHLGGSSFATHVDRSAGTPDRSVAKRALETLKRQIEDGEFSPKHGPTFVAAVNSYLDYRGKIGRGDRTFLRGLTLHFRETPIANIDQAAINEAAATLFPNGSAPTRNRQVYTPMSAVLRHAGVQIPMRRPKGGNGGRRKHWLRPEQAEALLSAAWTEHPRFGALLTLRLFCGCRLSEALAIQIDQVHLDFAFVDLPHTKNDEPQRLHLPPIVIHAIGLALLQPANATWTKQRLPRTSGSLFCLTKSSALYSILKRVKSRAKEDSGVELPTGVAFHLLRHTFGAWARWAGVRLEETGRWTSRGGAKPYDHYEITDAGRVADRFPGASSRSAGGFGVLCSK